MRDRSRFMKCLTVRTYLNFLLNFFFGNLPRLYLTQLNNQNCRWKCRKFIFIVPCSWRSLRIHRFRLRDILPFIVGNNTDKNEKDLRVRKYKTKYISSGHHKMFFDNGICNKDDTQWYPIFSKKCTGTSILCITKYLVTVQCLTLAYTYPLIFICNI